MKNVNVKGIVLRIADEIPEALKYSLKLIEDNYVVVRDNSKKILASIGVAAIAFTGCGRRVVNPAKPGSGNFEKDPGNSSSVSDTNPNETTITEDTTTYVVEEDGTTKYYVSDEWGTSYIEPQDVVTSGLYSSSSNGRKTTKTTPVGDETTTSEYNETTKLGDETSEQQETTDNTTRNYYTTSNSKTITSKTATSKTTTNTTRGTVTTSKTTTSKTTTTTTKKNNSSEPEIDGYKLSEIVNNQRAYAAFFAQLAYDMGHVDGYAVKFPGISFSWGGTEGTGECRFFLALLNSEYLDYFCDDVMYKFSSRSRFEYLANYKEFSSKVYYIMKKLGTSVDFTYYTLDYDKGVLLNEIIDFSSKGTLSQLSIPNKYKDDAAVLNLLYSCGINTDYSYMDPFLDKFSSKVFGKPFTGNQKIYTIYTVK